MDMKNWYHEDNMRVLCNDDTCTVYQLNSDSGEGLMTMYPVFPCCCILYSDFHMRACRSNFAPQSELFCIDHCREGRIEWETEPNRYVYVSAGDMQVDCRNEHTRDFYFPLQHYHGVAVSVDLQGTDNGVLHLMDDFSVDVAALREKFCPGGHNFIMRSSQQLDHIFSELYNMPEHNRSTYFKIKVMELFFFLQELDVSAASEARPYFYRTQVDKIKSMVELQTSDLTRWYTLDELSEKFSFPLTGMKQCFKGMYGCTMADYMKQYRMNTAAELLRGTSRPVIDIAAAVGYENPGKFSAAFRSVLGMTPTAYRKSTV